jgi:hypothetical protein
MTQIRILLLLIRPSWISFGAVGCATLLLFGFANWSFVTASPLLYDSFYGEGGIVTTLERSPDALSAMYTAISSSPIVYSVGLLVLALVAGVVVFVSIRSVEHGVDAFKRRGADAPFQLHEWRQRLLARLSVFVLWAIYMVFTANIALPYSLLLSRIGIEGAEGWISVVITCGAVMLLFVTLHINIIFARLMCLRPRVFGGEAAVESIFIK